MSKTVLIVPSTSAACGLSSYLSRMLHAFPDLPVSMLTTPGSDLHRALPDSVAVIATSGERRDISGHITACHESVAIQTHGRRALLAARLAKTRGRPVVHVYHELPSRCGAHGAAEGLMSIGIMRAANGAPMAAWLQSRRLKASWILPPVLQVPSLLTRGHARAFLGIRENRIAVGVVGRLAEVKKPLLAVDAVAHLPRNQRSRMTLCFVGEGPLSGAVEERAASMAIDARMLGHMPNASGLLAGFDVLVVPSPHETFCISLAEGALAGIPLAVVDSPGARLLSDGGRLLHLAKPTASELGGAIEQALVDGASAALAGHLAATYGAVALEPVYRAHYEFLTRSQPMTATPG